MEISHREWLAGYESSAVITTSRRMHSAITDLYQIPDEKISIIGNGVLACPKLDINQGRVKERYGIHPLAPVVFFVGRMVHRKGVDLLIEAIPYVLRHRWDVKFIFAGEGEIRWRYEELARELGVYESCGFRGYVSEEELELLMNACNLLCVPSRNEPFGIVVLEGGMLKSRLLAPRQWISSITLMMGSRHIYIRSRLHGASTTCSIIRI